MSRSRLGDLLKAARWAFGITVAVGLVLALTGDPHQRITVRCLDVAGIPKSAVRLELYCPANALGRAESAHELGATGPDGYLRFAGVGAHAGDCRIRVVGNSDAAIIVGDACKKKRFLTRSCVDVEAQLVVN